MIDEATRLEAIFILEDMAEKYRALAEKQKAEGCPSADRLNKCAEMLGIEERYTHEVMFVQLQQFVPIIEAIVRRIAN